MKLKKIRREGKRQNDYTELKLKGAGRNAQNQR